MRRTGPVVTGTSDCGAVTALHCNLNVRDLTAASRVYEQGLAMRVGMRSRAPEDSSALGLSGSTDAEAWFLYDHRGGRIAPAIELMRWQQPPMTGAAYGSPTHAGMQALGFTVPSVPEAADALRSAGATKAAGRRPESVDETVLDADGVPIELIEEPGSNPTLRYVRLVCHDLTRSIDWYGAIGFQATGPVRSAEWTTEDGDGRVDEITMALGPPAGFAVKLTSWHTGRSLGVAHDAPNHCGMVRMALGVEDVRSAAAAARDSGIDASDVIFLPLPGTPSGGADVSYFRDPDGVTVEFVELPRAEAGPRRSTRAHDPR